MSLTVAATAFGVIFLAELPDKSLFASLVLGTRHRGLFVWIGVSLAFAVHVTLAVLAGGLLTLLPHKVVEAVVALLFGVGSYLLLRPEPPEDEGVEVNATGRSPLSVIVACFGVVFLAEWGDVTQLAIANLAARYGDPLSVGLGAGLGLISLSAIAIIGGAKLLAHVPLKLVRRGAGLVLGGFAVATALQLLR